MQVNRGRGRPRQYDEDGALNAASQVFWVNGFSATSIDELSAAMGMNRPSIYRAFGDKEALYRKALAQFGREMEAAFERTLLAPGNIRAALTTFYLEALATYTSGAVPKGCLVMGTAVTAATSHPEIRADLLAVIRDLDRKLERRFQQAIDDGQLSTKFDPQTRAAMAQALLHTLSLRARAGESITRLKKVMRSSVAMILA